MAVPNTQLSASTRSMSFVEPAETGDEIVMTPLKAKVGQVLRVERMASGGLNERKAHYFAEGPYKGIVVNRATSVKPNKKAPETLRRFTAYVHHNETTTKEIREIRFWFKRDTPSQEMEEYTNKFFRELLNPTDFPKDYLQFVKRVLTLTQKYVIIKFLELEMRPFSEKDAPYDVRGQPATAGVRHRLRKTVSAAEPNAVVRQAASTDDIPAARTGKRKFRRQTASVSENVYREGPDDALPTVFVYNPGSSPGALENQSPAALASGGKKKSADKGSGSGMRRGEAMEDINFHVNNSPDTDNQLDASLLNGYPQGNTGMVQEEKITRVKSVMTGIEGGNPEYAKELNKRNSEPVKPRKLKQNATVDGSGPSLPEKVMAVLSSPSGYSGKTRASVDVPDSTATPSAAPRRSTRRPKSSSETQDSVFTRGGEGEGEGEGELEGGPSTAAYLPVSGSQTQEGPAAPPNERRRSRRKMRSISGCGQKLIDLLENAYPTMLSVDDLAGMSGMGREEASNELRKLLSLGMAAEIDTGMWVRARPPKKIHPSSPTNANQQNVDLKKNEFRMIASAPSLQTDDQPTIAIITSMFCEKLAVDAMMDIKTTYVKYRAEGGEGQLYTVGLIDRHRIVSTKLSKIGGEGSELKLSAGNAISRLLEAFGGIEHILLVGVGGGVADYDDDSQHVRLGDVVVSKGDRSNRYLYYQVSSSNVDDPSSITLDTRPWSCSGESELRAVVGKLQKTPKKLWKQVDSFVVDALAELDGEDASFRRPAPDTDRLYRTSLKTETEVPHPKVVYGSPRDSRGGLPLVHFGAVATGKILVKDDEVRSQFCAQQKVKAVDSGFQKVLDAVDSDERRSFAVVRGIADYGDGTKHKEWQAYASLTAAAVMKCLVMRLALPDDEDGLV